MTTQFHIRPGGTIQGDIAVPGDKSISHRAVMLAALAHGTSRITGFLDSADCLATLHVFEQLGVRAERDDALVIHGQGRDGLHAPDACLDVGNSGTSMRLLAGLLAGQAFASELTGDATLRRRPMDRVINPLRQMGAQITGTQDGCAPLAIDGGQQLQAIHYELPVASAQVKSCVLLAGLYAQGETQVIEPAPTRDHTERMLAAFGVQVGQCGEGCFTVAGGQRLTAANVQVPGDISSAAFVMVAAAICPGAQLCIRNVGVNPTRTGVVPILRAMGADIRLDNQRQFGGEPVADIHIRGGDLRGVEIDPSLVPLAIDEFPALFVAAACAQGETVLHGARELRVKESDRIAVMAEGLQTLGIRTEVYADGIRIVGGQLTGGVVDSHCDHRIAMSFAIAGPRATGPITINDCANVDTSFPGFAALMRQAGLRIQAHQ